MPVPQVSTSMTSLKSTTLAPLSTSRTSSTFSSVTTPTVPLSSPTRTPRSSSFVDHGGAGLICTPQGSRDWIYADELDSTLQTMKDQKMFGELVFYLVACESGSMFPNLNADENIYALTASNATQSS